MICASTEPPTSVENQILAHVQLQNLTCAIGSDDLPGGWHGGSPGMPRNAR